MRAASFGLGSRRCRQPPILPPSSLLSPCADAPTASRATARMKSERAMVMMMCVEGRESGRGGGLRGRFSSAPPVARILRTRRVPPSPPAALQRPSCWHANITSTPPMEVGGGEGARQLPAAAIGGRGGARERPPPPLQCPGTQPTAFPSLTPHGDALYIPKATTTEKGKTGGGEAARAFRRRKKNECGPVFSPSLSPPPASRNF